MIATFELKSAYGQVRAYPADESAKAICELAGSKTLTPATIGPARRLGFQLVSLSGTEIRPEHLY